MIVSRSLSLRKAILLLPFLILLFSGTSSHAAELIIASPHWEGIRYEFDRAFTKWFRDQTGESVNLRWRDLGGTSQIERAINASFSANPETAKIDVFFGGGIDPFENQKARGQLQPFRLPEPILEKIPRDLHGLPIVDPDFMFYGSALSSFGILENRRVVELAQLPEAREWSDLTHPDLFGWISSTDPRQSGSVHMIYEIILQAYGWEKGWETILQMSGNTRAFLQNSASPTKEVAVGEVAYAISIDINGLTQQAFLGPENVRFHVPATVSIINPDGIAILRGAPNQKIAEAFVTFVMSQKGQSLWMLPKGHPNGPQKFGITRMGILPELYESDTGILPLNPFEQENPLSYNSALGSRRWNVLQSLIGQSVIDVHSHLRRAWKAILDLPPDKRPPLLADFSKPPASEAQILAAAEFWNSDPVRAGKTANQWMDQAVTRFKNIESTARNLQKENNR